MRLNEAQTLNLRRNGFVYCPEENFSDDGNRFQVYYYDPQKTGDKRFQTTKCLFDGDAYISVRFYNEETGRTVYIDDLNGVPYETAIEKLPELVNKIEELKKKIDGGELAAKDLDADKIEEIKNKVLQLIELSDMSYYQALNTIYKKLNINSDELKKELRDEIAKDIEKTVRNARKDNKLLVSVLAKKALKQGIKYLHGTEGKYDSRGRWQSGTAGIESAEEAAEKACSSYDVSASTYSSDKEAQALIDTGLEANKIFYIKELTDKSQEKIKAWVTAKLQTLYDFDEE